MKLKFLLIVCIGVLWARSMCAMQVPGSPSPSSFDYSIFTTTDESQESVQDLAKNVKALEENLAAIESEIRNLRKKLVELRILKSAGYRIPIDPLSPSGKSVVIISSRQVRETIERDHNTECSISAMQKLLASLSLRADQIKRELRRTLIAMNDARRRSTSVTTPTPARALSTTPCLPGSVTTPSGTVSVAVIAAPRRSSLQVQPATRPATVTTATSTVSSQPATTGPQVVTVRSSHVPAETTAAHAHAHAFEAPDADQFGSGCCVLL